MGSGRKACFVGLIVALVVLGIMLPLKGTITYERDLTWVPNEKDSTILAAYVEEKTEIEEVDQLYLLQVLVEEEDYSAYFFPKVTAGGNAVATWLVRVPAPKETILKHQEELFPHVGLQAANVVVEDGVLYVATELDVGDFFITIFVSMLFFSLAALFTYGIVEGW